MSKSRDSRNEKKSKKKPREQAVHAVKGSRQLLKLHAKAVSGQERDRAHTISKQIDEAKKKAAGSQ